jgi:hypothetical protein
MARRVDLDAMIPREDFAIEAGSFAVDLIPAFSITYLSGDSPILKLLRKPDFQRETNHWSPEQLVTFVASFLDNEVIPSLILWKAPRYIFVIDGGHRLSALRAWMEDDYGDGAISLAFNGGEISDAQRSNANRARRLIEQRVGRYSTLRSHIENKASGDDAKARRAHVLFTRGLALQWIQGDASVAETSFFKINSQGTPLDDTEDLLIRNRRKPIAIAARAIIRAGSGHKYWSAFEPKRQGDIEKWAGDLNQLLFEPEVRSPIKTLDLPLGGSVSPVDALSLLIELLAIAGNRVPGVKAIDDYADDPDGDATLAVLQSATQVLNRITGNKECSLGLHPAVYFYNEQGKYSRFMFLAMIALVQENLRNNAKGFFVEFTKARPHLESFLMENKSLLGIVLQNLAKGQRVPKMKELFLFLIENILEGKDLTPEAAIAHIGLRGRVLDVKAVQTGPQISDNAKASAFLKQAAQSMIKCPICGGALDPMKSVSFDHIVRKQDGGTGDAGNTQLAHPYCNTGYKEKVQRRG